MKFENTDVFNITNAMRGMRNPMNSWDKNDSGWTYPDPINEPDNEIEVIGKNDLELAQKLIKAGSEHRKFLRQIFVSVDITAPLYWMQELDTYKIGTTRNSTSFMHKGMSKPFEIEDFEVSDEIKGVLSKNRKRAVYEDNPVYPYETDEFKYYETKNGRKYKVYRNGKIVICPFSYTDTKGRYREFTEKEKKVYKNCSGYFCLNLGGRTKNYLERWLLHRLVASVWIPNPNKYATVDHINGNKADNSVENLEWVSLEENVKREFANGLTNRDIYSNYKNWKASRKTDLTERELIRTLYSDGESEKELAEYFNLSQEQISIIVRNCNNTSENGVLFEQCYQWEETIDRLNLFRDLFLETKDDAFFNIVRSELPSSYLYRSTVTMNYENILNMYQQRCVHPHKLIEWSVDFANWVKSLPYAKEFFGAE